MATCHPKVQDLSFLIDLSSHTPFCLPHSNIGRIIIMLLMVVSQWPTVQMPGSMYFNVYLLEPHCSPTGCYYIPILQKSKLRTRERAPHQGHKWLSWESHLGFKYPIVLLMEVRNHYPKIGPLDLHNILS
jgi:hypothetical protein